MVQAAQVFATQAKKLLNGTSDTSCEVVRLWFVATTLTFTPAFWLVVATPAQPAPSRRIGRGHQIDGQVVRACGLEQ